MDMATNGTTNYGRRPLVSVIQERAQHGHKTPFGLIAKSANPADGFSNLSYQQLNAAADACAGLVNTALADTPDFTSFAWLGAPSDLRYAAMLLAAMKTKKAAFFPSPRNSLAVFLSLLERTDCNVFFVPDTGAPPVLDEILKQRPMQVVLVPSLMELAESGPTPVNFRESFDECWLNPTCILHTSGSTGIPKPVTLMHQYWTSGDAFTTLPSLGLQPLPLAQFGSGAKIYVPAPLFHCAGLFVGFACIVYYDYTIVSTPFSQLTADVANKVFELTAPVYAMIPGPIIKDLVEEPRFKANAGKVKLYSAAGAPIAKEVGERVAQFANYMNVFGMTEASGFPTEAVDPEDYQYHRFSPVLGADFRPAGDNEYEMVLVRRPGYEIFQPIFTTFPDLQEWKTNDLWSPHPSKPDLWFYRGRQDDIIVFSNGEKLNPLSIEGSVSACAGIKGAVVVGQGQSQAALILETGTTVRTEHDRQEVMNDVWPTLARINKDTVAHGRIAKDMIILADPDKPFRRAGKGTIQRRLTVQLYEQEIDHLYASQLHNDELSNGQVLDLHQPQLVEEALRGLIAGEVGVSKSAVTPGTDVFSLGMDSLMATNIARRINRLAGKSLLTARIIYNFPTISQLAAVLAGDGSQAKVATSRIELMQNQLDQLSEFLPINTRAPLPKRETVALLVGSTGNLGPYLLNTLLASARVQKVYCLNRSPNAGERQDAAHSERGLSRDFDRVEFLTADLTAELFSLGPQQFSRLLHDTTHVIHNAWPVNFNMALSSFSPSLRGLPRLVDFASSSVHGASLHFFSSVSAAMSYDGTVPEAPLASLDFARAEGYAESKAVGEALLARAVERSGITASVYRIGQIAGPVKFGGMWPKVEWLPAIVGSARALGCFPESLTSTDAVDWVPVDEVAAVVTELIFAEERGGGEAGDLRVRHIVNPGTTSWTALVPAVQAGFAGVDPPAAVPFKAWLAALQKKVAAGTEDANLLREVPAAKLVAFYEAIGRAHSGAPRFSTELASTESNALRALPEVSPEWMDEWMKQWKF